MSLGVVPISGNKIFCFGGVFQDGAKVLQTFSFDGNGFSPEEPLPALEDEEESTVFEDPVMKRDNYLYGYSRSGRLYKCDLAVRRWELLGL